MTCLPGRITHHQPKIMMIGSVDIGRFETALARGSFSIPTVLLRVLRSRRPGSASCGRQSTIIFASVVIEKNCQSRLRISGRILLDFSNKLWESLA
jgi:hypothetical protein